MFPSNPGNRRQYFYLPEGETSEVQSSADASCISREIWIAKVVSCIGQIIVSTGMIAAAVAGISLVLKQLFTGGNLFSPITVAAAWGLLVCAICWQIPLWMFCYQKTGMVLTFFTWDGSEFDSFDCLDNRIQMVDESVCNFAKADVSGSSNTAKRTSGSAGKCHVYAAGTGKECNRSGNLTQYGIICPVDSYDSKMVSEEDGSRIGKNKKTGGK